jgi:hypothetical protein
MRPNAWWALLQQGDETVVKEPAGEPQIDYRENGDRWVPRGDLASCILSDGGPDRELTLLVDDNELSLAEFGRLLAVHA